MQQTTNRKESYRSRSKSVAPYTKSQSINIKIKKSRLDFSVDANGYLIWETVTESTSDNLDNFK